MEIESFFPGRIRVSSALFKREHVVGRVRELLAGREGIRDIANNLRTGSLTVTYDSSIIDLDELMRAKSELELLERREST